MAEDRRFDSTAYLYGMLSHLPNDAYIFIMNIVQ